MGGASEKKQTEKEAHKLTQRLFSLQVQILTNNLSESENFHIFLETRWPSHYFCHLFLFSFPSPSVPLLPLHPASHFLSHFLPMPSATSPQVVTTTLDPGNLHKATILMDPFIAQAAHSDISSWFELYTSTTKLNTNKNVLISQR